MGMNSTDYALIIECLTGIIIGVIIAFVIITIAHMRKVK
jgi:hypothetical protein